jgi:hypothetical protein
MVLIFSSLSPTTLIVDAGSASTSSGRVMLDSAAWVYPHLSHTNCGEGFWALKRKRVPHFGQNFISMAPNF